MSQPNKQLNIQENTQPKQSNQNLILEGFLVSASNPKSVLFLTAIFPQFLTLEHPIIPQFGIMFMTIFACVGLIHGIYAIIAYHMRALSMRPKTKQWLARITGATFMSLGINVAFSK